MKSVKSPDELSLQSDSFRQDLTGPAVHNTAVVDPSAVLGAGVQVGAYSVIGHDVRIGNGTIVAPHVVIEPYTSIGEDCHIHSGAILGGTPQDRKFAGERSYVVIGDRNVIRECVTVHRATGEGNETRIGDDNMLMAYCHVGHNCELGNNIMMANTVGISGHVKVEDRANFGGMVGVHQFVRIGKLAMLGGYSKVVQDIPPFMMADGRPMRVVDLNVVGLRRSGVTAKVRAQLKQAYKFLYRSEMNLSQALDKIKAEIGRSEELDYLLDFMSHVKFGCVGRQLQHR